MKKVVSVLLVLCLLLGLTACGSKPTKTENTPTEKDATATTTTAPAEKKLGYADIVGGVRRVMAKDLPVFGSVTDEQQHTSEDGSITKSFKYADDLISVTVTLKNDDIQSVIALCNTAKMPADENVNSIQLSIVFMCVVGSVIYNDGDVYAMGDEIIASEPTTITDVGMTYKLKDKKWEYVMQLTALISTFYIAPIETEETTTTSAGKVTTSQPATKQPTSAQSTPATTQSEPTTTTRPTQNKPTSTKPDPTSAQSKPTTTKHPTQNKPTSTKADPTSAQSKPTTTKRPTQDKPTSTKSDPTSTQSKPTSPTTTYTQNQDPCAHGHDWEALYETVHYEEKGHYETVISGYNTVTTYKCAMCYEVFSSLDAYYSHFAQHEASSDSSASFLKERYETVTEQEPIYREEWVVDQAEETVEELIGYECRVCGKKKN